jgi:hypothetical protein
MNVHLLDCEVSIGVDITFVQLVTLLLGMKEEREQAEEADAPKTHQ